VLRAKTSPFLEITRLLVRLDHVATAQRQGEQVALQAKQDERRLSSTAAEKAFAQSDNVTIA